MGNGLFILALRFLQNIIIPPTSPPLFLISLEMAIKHTPCNDKGLRDELECYDKKLKEATECVEEAKKTMDTAFVRRSYKELNEIKEQQQRALQERVPPEVRKRARQEMIEITKTDIGIDCVRRYNFGFCGQSGTGKSSLINAVRYIKDNTKGAAKTDIVKCTGITRPYVHPKWKHVWMWDLPGTNTLDHPEETYFADKKLYAFDCLLIIFSERFLATDMHLALSAFHNQVPVTFVRTKADHAIRDQVRSSPTKKALEASKILRQRVGSNLKENLLQVGLQEQDLQNMPLFIVSSPAYTRSNAYHNSLDTSLKEMDEKKLYLFLSSSLVRRNSVIHA